jgi:hypothetical protein
MNSLGIKFAFAGTFVKEGRRLDEVFSLMGKLAKLL